MTSNDSQVLPSLSNPTFQSSAGICKIIGVTCTEDLTDTLIKIKKEKGNNAPTLIRLLKCLRNS
jgi:hypothetical protein